MTKEYNYRKRCWPLGDIVAAKTDRFVGAARAHTQNTAIPPDMPSKHGDTRISLSYLLTYLLKTLHNSCLLI